MINPNTAQIVDYAFSLLDLELQGSKRKSIDSLSEFQNQNKVFHEKTLLISQALCSKNNELFIYIENTMGTFLNSIKEINSNLAPLAMDNSSEQKNRITFICYWYIPFIISAINKLEGKIESVSFLNTLKEWLIEILRGSEDTKAAIESKSIDVEAFIRRKLSHVIPRGVCGDIKNKLASNKGWKSFSFNENNSKKLIEDIKTDLSVINEGRLIPHIVSIFKAGGVMRNALKNYSFEELHIPNYEEVISTMDRLLLSPEQVEENISSFKQIDSSKELTNAFQILNANLIKENNPISFKEMKALDNMLKRFDNISFIHDITSSLLALHKFIGGFEQFEPELLDKTITRCQNTKDNKICKIIISNAHEQARKEFIEYIEKLENMGASRDKIIQLSCIVLAVSFVMLTTVQNNKMTKLLAIIRRNLSSFGEFCDMPTFSTCFSQKSLVVIDYQRFDEDSQLFTYAIRVYNQLIIKNVPPELYAGSIIMPLMHVDFELENLLDSFSEGKFSKSKAKKLSSLKRFWRVDQSSVYEALRDIDFYIKVFGVQLDGHRVIVPPSIDKYLRLSNKNKKVVLKMLDPEQYAKDEADEKKALEARKAGELSYKGVDGLPVYFSKTN